MSYKPQPVLSEEQRATAKRRYKWLAVTIKVYGVALVAVYVAAILHSDAAMFAAWAALGVSGITYLVLLNWLASLLGKSAIVYVGGALITSPIGQFVSFAFMQREASRAGLT